MLLSNDQILVIGDRDRRMQNSVASALPTASVTSVQSVFDALAELNAGVYSGVLVNVDPLQNRPEAATRALREAAGEARLVVYSDPAHEPLSINLTQHGADDYVIAPADNSELQNLLAMPVSRVVEADQPLPAPQAEATPDVLQTLRELPMTDIVLTAMLDHPQQAIRYAIADLAQRVAPGIRLSYSPPGEPVPAPTDTLAVLTHPIRAGDADANIVGVLVMEVEKPVDEPAADHTLCRMAQVLGKVAQVDDRQSRLQKLAITDELTGVYNGRYFKHFLTRILEKAKAKRFPVTLFLFDIDNFKKYNDTYGHAVGDEILRQTASAMKRSSRDHDLVARISGDEFAVVFWEKEGPRQAYDQQQPASRLPNTPLIIADRFRKLLGNKDFTEFSMLGTAGKGVLTISGGMAVYPYDAQTADDLIDAADKALMFGAKKGGKNSIYLVGGDQDAALGASD